MEVTGADLIRARMATLGSENAALQAENKRLRDALEQLLPEAQRYFEDYCPTAAEDMDMGDVIRQGKAALREEQR